jgi:hypothetical protein
MIYLFEEIVESKTYTTIMTLVEKRCLLAVYKTSSLILMFSGIPTYGASKVPKIIPDFLKFFHPRGT